MSRDSSSHLNRSSHHSTRRQFLHYFIGSTTGFIALGFLQSYKTSATDLTLEELCSQFPQNSRCANYLPGVQAKNMAGQIVSASALLATATVGQPLPVKGLSSPDVDYLVITSGPQISSYAIKPVCTHLGCTVAWKADQNRFICPCHGSQYDVQGRVTKGPAARDLPLITVVVKQDQVRLVDRAPAVDPRKHTNQ